MIGSTKRAKEKGKPQRNAANKQERATWQKDRNATNGTFPIHTCNGKKNRKKA